ncbi:MULTISPECIES: TIGR03767 family metallophosphoesterase [unclassified Streptomyces]|uniref:TIGR03767 family metallophosphoesterase n=1 Tax=unclassified Streptomyces TaxID=2593676 RepID=UPI002E34C78B|nr:MULTISPECIES: TIGR03767 family metallophosphoesterase [unclassified Streptomyces]
MGISRRRLLTTTGVGVVAAAIDAGGLGAAAEAATRTAGHRTAAARKTVAAESASDAPGATTWDRTVQRESYAQGAGYQRLVAGPGEAHTIRTDLWSRFGPPTTALAAFAQMTDLHIVDDQSPARLEFMDRYADAGPPHHASYPTDSAYRGHEFLSTQVVDAMCQAIADVGKGPRSGKPLQFTIVTGDAIDNCQHNENRWYIDLLDGGRTIVPDSGRTGLDQSFSGGALTGGGPADDHYYYPSVPPQQVPGNRYTGTSGLGFPYVPGLLDASGAVGAARRPFVSHGLGMPWYAAYGNHDGLWQGNEPIDNNLVDVQGMTVGSSKTTGTSADLPDDYSDLGTFGKLMVAWDLEGTRVVADPERRLLTRKAFIQDHFNTAGLPVGHGFQGVGIDKAYYAIPSGSGDLIRYLTLDSTNTNTDGFGSGAAGGSIDSDQLGWLEQQLRANSSRYIDTGNRVVTQSGVQDKMYVLFCHHTLATMDNLDDGIFGGIFGDRHTGDELKALLLRYPNVIALVNGHTHANRITPHPTPAGSPISGGFWEISTASHIDWPIQSRIIEIMASPDAQNAGEFGSAAGPATLSIFTTMVDPAAPLSYGGDTSTPAQLASLARELATNDPQEVNHGITNRMGVPQDRNTQLLLPAPFPLHAPHPLGSPIAAARNKDGRLELFGTDAQGNLWNTSRQATTGGGLQPWTKLAAGPGWQSVTAAGHQDGRVEVFAIDQNGSVTRRAQTSAGSATYTAAQQFDSAFTSATAVQDQWGGMQVYATRGDNTIRHRWQDFLNDDTASNGWFTPWTQLGGTAIQLAVETGSDGRAVLVAIKEDGLLIQRRMNVANAQTESEWGGVLPLDGILDSVDLARNLDGRLALFGTNPDGMLWRRFETAPAAGTWQGWSQMPTRLGTTTLRMRHVCAERNGSGRIELFAVDSTGTLYHSTQNDPSGTTWSAWESCQFQLRATHTSTGL